MTAPPSLSPQQAGVDHLLQLYGDLLFDLCDSVLWNAQSAQLAFRAAFKEVRRGHAAHAFAAHERAWVLQRACGTLMALAPRHARKLTASEQIQLDASQNPAIRLKNIESYFHRLTVEDQILLLLRDKYGLPYPEISSALGLPEGTLKLRRTQALRPLEEWIWDQDEPAALSPAERGAPGIDCFELQNRTSDCLDGSLIGAAKREADEHLDSCPACGARHKHYRLLLTAIASQPRTALPVSMRKAPFASPVPRLEMARLGRSRWEQIPWYVRTTLEGTSIVALILLGISTGPKVRALYERNIERNFNDYSEALNHPDASPETIAMNVPLSRGKSLSGGALEPGAPAETIQGGDEGDDEDGGEGGDLESAGSSEELASSDALAVSAAEAPDVRVGNSEIWRFNFKTDSPHEFRPKIVQALAELKVPPTTPGFGGIEAPGGIQFDLMLPQSAVGPLKKQLEKLAPPTPEGLGSSPAGERFTWYKNKAKNAVPAGQTHVVIWLSLM